MLVEMVTPEGWRFWGESLVEIDGESVALNEMSQEQRSWVATALNANALNAAFAGRLHYRAQGLPEFREVFPEKRKDPGG